MTEVACSLWHLLYNSGGEPFHLRAAVEDPFDATDNCARTIGFSKIDSIVTAFGRAAAVINSVRDEAGGLAFSVAITQHMVNPLTSLTASMCPGAQ